MARWLQQGPLLEEYCVIDSQQLFELYQDLQRYLNWQETDAHLVRSLGPHLTPYLPAIVDDFYEEIARHPAALRVITGGDAQVARLKKTLTAWLEQLLAGVYDEQYVMLRWRVGLRHVEIGLDQVYTNIAVARLRWRLLQTLDEVAPRAGIDGAAAASALNRLLDLDLAIIQVAYETEYVRRLSQHERLATIGQMAGGVAHELRNPLNVMKTSVYYLLHARRATPEKTVEHLQRIQRQVALADGVISALVEFARQRQPQLAPVDLLACLHEAAESSSLSEQIQLRIELPPALPPVNGDGRQLVIVFRNLIRNAADAMLSGGVLSISAEPEGSSVVVQVSDTGVGMSAEDLERIRQPLYTTKARGMGLGLAICRGILERHGAQLQLVSEQGRGTTVTVRLRVAAEAKP
ncbi:MAG: hypothetical protein K6T86_10550 [Pirellulales bacterium]|nr:hypothetical protein [Pirellulales bacterium]